MTLIFCLFSIFISFSSTLSPWGNSLLASNLENSPYFSLSGLSAKGLLLNGRLLMWPTAKAFKTPKMEKNIPLAYPLAQCLKIVKKCLIQYKIRIHITKWFLREIRVFAILAFSTNFCPVWQHCLTASFRFSKIAKIDYFLINFCPLKM